METTSELTIRPARAEDALEVHRVFCQAIDAIDSRFYSPDQRVAWKGAVAPESWTTRMIELEFFVGESQGKIVGFISWFGPEIVHVYALGRCQIGRRLMEFALNSIEFAEVTLTSSLNAEAFYASFGFEATEMISKERGGVQIPCIRMRRCHV